MLDMEQVCVHDQLHGVCVKLRMYVYKCVQMCKTKNLAIYLYNCICHNVMI